ncbi:hypothetical protein D7317_07335 [Legionella pneumophila]|nr:hypothetical protein D7317_07335 [Legionella pneumophila]RYW72705.1 hypothetical protein D7300_03635 [Legionella pneumophila]RYX64462.1 hypothetical protein D7297_06230 [Legionella pneumophila]
MEPLKIDHSLQLYVAPILHPAASSVMNINLYPAPSQINFLWRYTFPLIPKLLLLPLFLRLIKSL